jgi:hypothetical protein
VIPFSSIELGISSQTFFGNKKSGLPYEKSYIYDKAQTVLLPKKDHLLRLLSRVGLRAYQLTSDQIVKLFFSMYNPNTPPPDMTRIDTQGGHNG